MNIRCCPEKWKHCNGLNRHYRIKVLLNVAEFYSKSYSAKTQRVGKLKDIFVY